MGVSRRRLLRAGTGLGVAATGVIAAAATGQAGTHRLAAASEPKIGTSQHAAGLRPGIGHDSTAALQRAIDAAATQGQPVNLPSGRFVLTGRIILRNGTRLIGAHGTSHLILSNPETTLAGDGIADVELSGLVIEGTIPSGQLEERPGPAPALIDIRHGDNIVLDGLKIRRAPANAISLEDCTGSITGCIIENVTRAAIFSNNARGLEIAHNTVRDAGDNGILIWRDRLGRDGTIVTHNRIERVRAKSGGSGQNGNAINVFRAGNVIVSGNSITDCAFSAVRGNAASDLQIIANNCTRLGEVALYAEFGFEGTVIANNVVNGAATGIEVTNFEQGGRLAVVQGNLIRNLFRREHEKVDTRGIAIAVEADTTVTGNTMENAPTAGLYIGWGRWMRNVAASNNIMRNTRIGIAVSSFGHQESVLLNANVIQHAEAGGIRLMDHHRPVGKPLESRPTTGRHGVQLAANLIS